MEAGLGANLCGGSDRREGGGPSPAICSRSLADSSLARFPRRLDSTLAVRRRYTAAPRSCGSAAWSRQILLQSGADPNAVNRRGATPLHYACDPRPTSGGTWAGQLRPRSSRSWSTTAHTWTAATEAALRPFIGRYVRGAPPPYVSCLSSEREPTVGCERAAQRRSTSRLNRRAPVARLGHSISSSRSSASCASTARTPVPWTRPTAHHVTGRETRVSRKDSASALARHVAPKDVVDAHRELRRVGDGVPRGRVEAERRRGRYRRRGDDRES